MRVRHMLEKKVIKTSSIGVMVAQPDCRYPHIINVDEYLHGQIA